MTMTELMIEQMNEETRERYKLIWANLSEEKRALYLKELDEAVKAATKTLKEFNIEQFNTIKTLTDK